MSTEERRPSKNFQRGVNFVRSNSKINNNRKQKLELHGNLYSPPCRIVSLTLECLNLKYKLVEVWPLKGETKTQEFLKGSAFKFWASPMWFDNLPSL